MLATTAEASSTALLVGVLSFNLPQRRARRDALRVLCPSTPQVHVRYILPLDGEEDASEAQLHDDVWRMAIATAARSRIGKFLLQNAFFRRVASSSRRYRWVARIDDDAATPLNVIAASLRTIETSAATRGVSLVVYGPVRSWYMWHPDTLRPSCFDSGAGRRARACETAEPPDECCAPGLIGPFPFAAGAATVYSYSLVAEVLADLPTAHEQRALAIWNATSAPQLASGRARPQAKLPPILLEDVYYASLMYERLRTRRVALVNAPCWDPPAWKRSVHDWLVPAHVYHNLKSAAHFRRLRRAWTVLSNTSWSLVCERRRGAGEVQRVHARAWSAAVDHGCCARWQACTFAFAGPESLRTLHGSAVAYPSPHVGSLLRDMTTEVLRRVYNRGHSRAAMPHATARASQPSLPFNA